MSTDDLGVGTPPSERAPARVSHHFSEEPRGISRREFLRAAGTLGVSGGLLGAHMGQARGQDGDTIVGMPFGRRPRIPALTAGTARWARWTPRGSTRPS